MSAPADVIPVRGGATAEEPAAVIAVVAGRERAAVPDPYRVWRRTRVQAIRRSPTDEVRAP